MAPLFLFHSGCVRHHVINEVNFRSCKAD